VLSPFEAYAHLRETLIAYLSTVYKISNQVIAAERLAMLRAAEAVASAPLIESTPAFPTSRSIRELERSNAVAGGLFDLLAFGTPLGTNALYVHQETALSAVTSEGRNLVLASGTGSGKTEVFLAAILHFLLREARNPTKRWPRPRAAIGRGTYDAASQSWSPSRRNETRTAAVRGIVLYPMNALVGDQAMRLRRVLATDLSMNWQKRMLNDNLIHFGMYTGQSTPSGPWTQAARRTAWAGVERDIGQTWSGLEPKQQSSGRFARLDGPEMLCRWDMQLRPPDILITNYSMLEYMLIRPIESRIFDLTRQWLADDANAVLTLVIDEAHTYSGARGTEVALLIRRLRQRLGLQPGTRQMRCIATSASLPARGAARQQVASFAGDLFGEPAESFTVVAPESGTTPAATRCDERELRYFVDYWRSLQDQGEESALRRLAESAGLSLDRQASTATQAGQLSQAVQAVTCLRNFTTRKALPLRDTYRTLWPDASDEDGQQAIAGVLALGALGRMSDGINEQPVLASRIHLFLRGVLGIWACLNPLCDQVATEFRGSRPVGRLYLEPQNDCACGGRVLELLSCRACGLLYMGGVLDAASGALWPWHPDPESPVPAGQVEYVFGVEDPRSPQAPVATWRSAFTTQVVAGGSVGARPIWETPVPGQLPSSCPRCLKRRAPGPGSVREVVESLRTRGSRSFSAVVDDAFRVQAAQSPRRPNEGRKTLTFADSRQGAATLAGDMLVDHRRDLFRQVLYRLLVGCRSCNSLGRVGEDDCRECHGTGSLMHAPESITVDDLRHRVFQFCLARGIDPTFGDNEHFFSQHERPTSLEASALREIDQWIRDEIAAPAFGLEPFGLARWSVPLRDVPALPGLSTAQSEALIQAVLRVLATENVLLPVTGLNINWSANVRNWEKNLLVTHAARQEEIPFTFAPPRGRQPGRKLARLFAALQPSLGAAVGPAALPGLEAAVLRTLLSNNVLTRVRSDEYGIRINAFVLEQIPAPIYTCDSCGYVSSSSIGRVCLRCYQTTTASVPADNFYSRTTRFAEPLSGFPDPFPLLAREHTGALDPDVARKYERWFQDEFHGDESDFDSRIDVLSVTTTMEMGIDIGSLLCAALRNVPPTVANYQQRAGRAGRRGSATALVVTYCEPRPHDQYYFHNQPEIVTDPPRIPALQMGNPVLSERHLRAIVLQRFFAANRPQGVTSALLGAWGTVADWQTTGRRSFVGWLTTNEPHLAALAKDVIALELIPRIPAWLSQITSVVDAAVGARSLVTELLDALLDAGVLPRYAFPVDVVQLYTEPLRPWSTERGLQRDLSIAMSEYAPGGEVVRDMRVYRVAGLYDPYARTANYTSSADLFECRDCKATLEGPPSQPVLQCPVCTSLNVEARPFIDPRGFTTVWGQEERYMGGGRDRGGSSSPARLLVGPSSFVAGTPAAFTPRLRTYAREGDLFTVNQGLQAAGFNICSVCGTHVDLTQPQHVVPADQPPLNSPASLRHGARCPAPNSAAPAVWLAHHAPSEILLLGVELVPALSVSPRDRAARAAWTSLGTAIQRAASLELQIDPGEIAVGWRPAMLPSGQLSAELFMYDTLPGGAGYARDIELNLEEILVRALLLSENCPSQSCRTACHRCFVDYKNQRLAGMLDRGLAADLLRFLLSGTIPDLPARAAHDAMRHFAPYLSRDWRVSDGDDAVPFVFERRGRRVGIRPVHSLLPLPTAADLAADRLRTNSDVRSHRLFDLRANPFSVLEEIAT
jgi:ATP-dependent helicase YprA (DUF1998 family)